MKTRGLFKSLFISFFVLNIFTWGCSGSSESSTGNDSTASQSKTETSKHTRKQSENFDQEFKILLVGPSGHGKSSLINTIANLASGKKSTDQKDFLIKTQHDDNQYPCTVDRYQSRNVEVNIDPRYSQTIASSSYNTGTAKYVFLNQDQPPTRKQIKLTIFDTPGINIERANRNVSVRIKNDIEQIGNANQLNAIALVISYPFASTSRSDLNAYISEFQKILPEKYKDNLIRLLAKL